MPGNRVRVVTDWLLDALLPTQAVQLGLVRGGQVPLGPKPELEVASRQHGEQGVVDTAVAGHDIGDGR
jgi:NADH dehydrogenase